MNTETREGYIEDLTDILKLLKSEIPIQEQITTKIHALYAKTKKMSDSLLATKKPLKKFSMQFHNFVTVLGQETIDLPNKILIVEGLIPFVNDFLDETKKEPLSVTNSNNKILYLKMIDAAHPLFSNNVINSDIVYENANSFRGYLIYFRDIILTFPKLPNDEFKNNMRDCIDLIYNDVYIKKNKVTPDLMIKIDDCLSFISDIKVKVEAENNIHIELIKKFWPHVLSVLIILITVYFVKGFVFSNPKSVLKS